jgi:hypothetical protein
MGRKIFTIVVIWGLLAVGESYGLLDFGIRGGYRTGNLELKEGERTVSLFGLEATIPLGKEKKPLSGLGIEVFGKFSPPALPMSIEGGIGVNNTAVNIEKSNPKDSIHYWVFKGKYKASTINLFTFCSYKLPLKVVSPYIGGGPYLGIIGYTYQIEDEAVVNDSISVKVTSKKSTTFGFRGGTGAYVNLIPKLGINIGIVYDYYLGPKGDETLKFSFTRDGNTVSLPMKVKTKYSHGELGILVGLTYTMM